MTWNLIHLARLLKDAGGVPAYGNQRRSGTPAAASTSRPGVPLTPAAPAPVQTFDWNAVVSKTVEF